MKKWKDYAVGFFSGIIFAIIMLGYVIADARTIKLQTMTMASWIFVIVGTIIVLLQLIPAALLFFSFMGSVYKKKRECSEAEIPVVEEASDTPNII